MPTGVYSVKVVAIGGTRRRSDDGPAGGEAAEVAGSLEVDPGQTLYIEVGGNGQKRAEGGEGGFNGGGRRGGGGGGASDIRTAPRSTPLATEDTRLLVAAGGGGGGGDGVRTGAGANGGAAESPVATGTWERRWRRGHRRQKVGLAAFGCVSATAEAANLASAGTAVPASEADPGGGGGGGLLRRRRRRRRLRGRQRRRRRRLLARSRRWPHEPDLGRPQDRNHLQPAALGDDHDPVDEAAYTQGEAVNASYSCLPGEGTGLKTCAGKPARSPTGHRWKRRRSANTLLVQAEDNDKGKPAKTSATPSSRQKNRRRRARHPPGRLRLRPTPASPPDTILGSHPKKTVKTKKKKAKVKFSFSSDVAGATFQCKLDKGAFAPCTSPKTYKVKPGRHTFSVEAVAPGGTDATPATFSFKVKKKT